MGRVGRTVTARRSRAAVVGLWGELGADWALRGPDRSDPGLDGTWEFLSVVRWDGPPGRLSAAFSATVETSGRLWTTKRVEHAYGPYELVGCQAIVCPSWRSCPTEEGAASPRPQARRRTPPISAQPVRRRWLVTDGAVVAVSAVQLGHVDVVGPGGKGVPGAWW